MQVDAFTPEELDAIADNLEVCFRRRAGLACRELANRLRQDAEEAQRNERCVLPKELRDVEFFTSKRPNGWLVSLFRDPSIESLGDTLEAAIAGLARKLRER